MSARLRRLAADYEKIQNEAAGHKYIKIEPLGPVWEAEQVRESHNVFIFVYGNENFDEDVLNLPCIGNIGQHIFI